MNVDEDALHCWGPLQARPAPSDLRMMYAAPAHTARASECTATPLCSPRTRTPRCSRLTKARRSEKRPENKQRQAFASLCFARHQSDDLMSRAHTALWRRGAEEVKGRVGHISPHVWRGCVSGPNIGNIAHGVQPFALHGPAAAGYTGGGLPFPRHTHRHLAHYRPHFPAGRPLIATRQDNRAGV